MTLPATLESHPAELIEYYDLLVYLHPDSATKVCGPDERVEFRLNSPGYVQPPRPSLRSEYSSEEQGGDGEEKPVQSEPYDGVAHVSWAAWEAKYAFGLGDASTPCPATPNIIIGDLLEASSCMDEEGYGPDAVSTDDEATLGLRDALNENGNWMLGFMVSSTFLFLDQSSYVYGKRRVGDKSAPATRIAFEQLEAMGEFDGWDGEQKEEFKKQWEGEQYGREETVAAETAEST